MKRLIGSIVSLLLIVCVGALVLERFNVIDLDDVLTPPAAAEQVL